MSHGTRGEGSRSTTRQGGRPYIGMLFRCCQVYVHIYLNRAGDAYAGHCPRCARPVRIRVGPNGSKERFWEAG
jgi:hypothetical protein